MGKLWDEDLVIAIQILMVVAAVAVAAPVVLTVIRLLNQTWLDPEWRAARNSRHNLPKSWEGADAMSLAVTEQQIMNALHAVPAERWAEILRFLNALQANTPPTPENSIQTADDLLRSGLVGIWADRIDLGDSRDFARRLREQAERREGGPNAAGQ